MDLKQGDLENIILNALWDLEEEGQGKIYVSNVQEKIKTDRKEWAYTTVKTVLDRLVDKEISAREKDGKKYFYRSLLKRDDAGVRALTKVIQQYFQNDISNLEQCLSGIKSQKPFGSRSSSTSGIGERTNNSHESTLIHS